MKKRGMSVPAIYLLLFGMFAILIVGGMYWYNSYLNTFPVDSERHELADMGVRGDAFGGINALFSGLGIAGVIIAIIMQSVELRNQQLEMRNNTNSLLLSSYLQALDSLRQYYSEQLRNQSLPRQEERTLQRRYLITMDKLSSLVKHLEENEAELDQLEGASYRQSEKWLDNFKTHFQTFQLDWDKEMKKDKPIRRHLIVISSAFRNRCHFLLKQLDIATLKKEFKQLENDLSVFCQLITTADYTEPIIGGVLDAPVMDTTDDSESDDRFCNEMDTAYLSFRQQITDFIEIMETYLEMNSKYIFDNS